MTDIVSKNQANIAEGVHVACVYGFPTDQMIQWICQPTCVSHLSKILFARFAFMYIM